MRVLESEVHSIIPRTRDDGYTSSPLSQPSFLVNNHVLLATVSAGGNLGWGCAQRAKTFRYGGGFYPPNITRAYRFYHVNKRRQLLPSQHHNNTYPHVHAKPASALANATDIPSPTINMGIRCSRIPFRRLLQRDHSLRSTISSDSASVPLSKVFALEGTYSNTLICQELSPPECLRGGRKYRSHS